METSAPHSGDPLTAVMPPGRSLESLSLGEKIESMLQLLESCNSRDRLRLLRGAGGAFGHKVQPGFLPQVVAPQAPTVGGKPKAPRQPKSVKSAEQRSIDKQIKDINVQILAASKESGARLQPGHPLLVSRQRLFHVKRGEEASGCASPSEAEHQDPRGLAASGYAEEILQVDQRQTTQVPHSGA